MPLRSRTCHHCKASYQPIRKDQKFCSTSCKTASVKSKAKKATQRKIERRVSRLRRTGFGLYLVREVIRAKTIQILSHHTADTLHELDQLRSDCFVSNGVSLDGTLNKVYELSHICPVNSKGLVGLLHPHNLVIANKTYNRSRGTSYSGGGKFITRQSLKSEWYVDDQTPVSKVYDKIERFLGPVLKEYLEAHNPKLSYKERMINKIIRSLILEREFTSKEQKKAFEDKARRTLSHMPVDELEQRVLIQGDSLSSFNRGLTRYLPLMMKEVKRFEGYGVHVDGPFKAYAQYLQTIEQESWTSQIFLDVQHYDYQENEWVSPSIQYWMAQQLCKMLHKERPDSMFEGKHYIQHFTLPKQVPPAWKPSHNVEEWQVAQHGMPAVEARVLYNYMAIDFDKAPAPFELDGYVSSIDLSIQPPTQEYLENCPF